jgi:hypothetical protein
VLPAVGERLGHFEILAPLGAGGMGVVYRARDTRLGRDVALKVLPEAFSRDAGRLSRFEREARVLATLSHPGIAAIHGLEPGDDGPVLVMELVEGEGLDKRLARGRIPVRQALELARQMAAALESAHAKGIIHRDLKPSNIQLTPEGQVKLLDFGLAKAFAPGDDETAATEAVDGATAAGVVVGTAPYMSPEQARAEAVDRRTDVWSFGCVLYEMLAGGRAFPGHTAEAVAAVLEREPVWRALPGEAPPKVLDLLRRCLQKDRNHRLHDIADARIELEEALAEPAPVTAPAAPAVGRPSRRWRWALAAAGLLFLAGLTALGFYWGRRTAFPPHPLITRLTFRPGLVTNARFTPDAQTVVYSAKWSDGKLELFSQRIGSNEARTLPLGPGVGMVQAASGTEALVTMLYSKESGPARLKLVRTPLEGGSPRELARGVWWADWTADGSRMAVNRLMGDQYCLEYPLGRVLFTTTGRGLIQNLRVSPSGDHVAFIHWPAGRRGDNNRTGDLMVADSAGRVRVLSGGWANLAGLGWSPDGREVWFTATRHGLFHYPQSLHAVTLSGRHRTLLRLAHSVVLADVSRDGRVLVVYENRRMEARGRLEGDTTERDLSWFDRTTAVKLMADGRTVVFGEEGEAGGPLGATYLWRVGSAPPVRLSEGLPLSVSPDGAWVACLVAWPEGRKELRLVPTGPGEPRLLATGTVEPFQARFLPDGRGLVLQGVEPGRPFRVFVQDLSQGTPRPALPEGWTGGVPTPDGRFITAQDPGGGLPVLQPLDGGEPRSIAGARASDVILQFDPEGRTAFVRESCVAANCRWVRLDLRTGQRSPWLDMTPPDRTGVTGIINLAVHPGGRSYAYTYERVLSDLYMIEGLK